MGEAKLEPLRVDFDRRLKLEFHGIKLTSRRGISITVDITKARTAEPVVCFCLRLGARREVIDLASVTFEWGTRGVEPMGRLEEDAPKRR